MGFVLVIYDEERKGGIKGLKCFLRLLPLLFDSFHHSFV